MSYEWACSSYMFLMDIDKADRISLPVRKEVIHE